jgi:hypothetical protein
MMDRLEKGLSAKDVKDEVDIKKQYDDIAAGLTKEMAGIKAFVSALSNTTEDVDGLIRTIFFAYQKTKPRLQQIRDLRNSWHEWPGYIPRRRPKGQIMMRAFEEYTDETGAIKKKEVYAGMLESITQAGKEAEANKHYAEVVKRFGKDGKLHERFKFEYQAESQTPEGAFDGVKDFNVQMLIDNALDNMDKKGDYFDKNGKKVDVKMEIWDSAFDAIAGQFQQRGAASYNIRRKQELGEKAIKGYVEEGLDQILIDYVTSVTGFATKQVAAYKTTEILSSLEDKTRMNELREYANGQFRNDTELDKFSSKVRSLAFMWFLGLNLKSVAVNSTQPIIVGIPELDRWMRANKVKGSGFLAQMKASRDVAKNGDIFFKSPDSWDDNLNGISEVEKQFIEDATIAGSMAAQHIRMIKGLTSTYGKLWNKVFDIAALPFATIEKYNRTTSGLAMFRVALEHYKSTGLTEAQAIEKATEDALHFINLVHYPIGKHNLPIPAQAGNEFGVAFKTAYTFRPFTHNFLLNQFNLLRSAARLRNVQAEEGKTEAQVRAEATNDLITFVHTMALVGLFGGLLGLPFLKDIFDFFEKHYGYSPKQWARTTLRNVGGETLETFGMGGLPAVLGGNISGSLAIGVPFMNVDPSATVFGVYEGMGVKAKRAAEAALRGDPYRAVANMTPEFLRNPVVALTESDFGKEYLGSRGFATTPQGKVSYASTGKALSYTGGEAVLKTIGFQPTRISKEREIEQTVKAQMLWADEKKKNIAETLNIDKLQNDPKAMQKMFKAVQEINADIRERNIPVPLAKVSTILKNARDIKNLRKRRELKRRQELSE